jgi:hypothetical protein
MKMLTLERIVELPKNAFKKVAGTTFTTYIAFFRCNGSGVKETQFFRAGEGLVDCVPVGCVPISDLRGKGDWVYDRYQYVASPKSKLLGEFVELVEKRYPDDADGVNPLAPGVDAVTRLLVQREPPKVTPRLCVKGCLYVCRIVSASRPPHCGIVTKEFDNARTTREFLILKPKRSEDLTWLWFVLNNSDAVKDYLNAMVQGSQLRRVSDEDFLKMPVSTPTDESRAIAEEALREAVSIQESRQRLQTLQELCMT